MNIVKWILGRPLVAIWVLGAIAILLAMSSGNKKHEIAGDSHAINSDIVHTKKITQATKKVQATKNAEATKNVQTAKNEIKPNHNEVTSVEASSELKPIPEVRIKNEKVQGTVLPSAVAQVTAEHSNATLHKNSEPFESTISEDIGSNNPTKKSTEIEGDLGRLETEELLLMAREAYWNNGLDEAAQIYQQLIIREPQVIEHKGELGNVYWRQGYPKKAAELYSEIAIPLIESGSSERVTNMLGFIQLFFPDRVEVIKDRLQRNDIKANH